MNKYLVSIVYAGVVIARAITVQPNRRCAVRAIERQLPTLELGVNLNNVFPTVVKEIPLQPGDVFVSGTKIKVDVDPTTVRRNKGDKHNIWVKD